MFNFRLSKKGQEMSVNVVVGIILGLIMFIAAVFIFFKIMGDADKTQETLDEQTRLKMVSALDSGEPIYIPESIIDVEKDKAVIWVGIRNIADESREFRIDVECLNVCPFNLNSSDIIYLNNAKLILAKDNDFSNVVINMDGVTSQANLTLRVESKLPTEPETGWKLYGKPKIIFVKP